MSAEITYKAEQVFGADKIEEWTKEGHWPPPPGCTVLPPRYEVDPKKVAALVRDLIAVLPRNQQKILREAFSDILE